MDTWAKEAVEPTDQHVGIQRAVDKANGVAGVRSKYGVASIWCKYGAEGLYPLLEWNGGTDKTCTQLRRRVDSKQAPMDPLLLCGVPRLSLCGVPTVPLCGVLQPIGAVAPSLLYGAPSIMLCS